MHRKSRLEEIKSTIGILAEESGQIPSQERIREALGHVGSMTTINKALKEWREENAGHGAPSFVIEAAQRLYKEINERAQLVLDQQRAKMLDQLEEMRRELHAVTMERNYLTGICDEAKKKDKRSEKELAAARLSLTKEQTRTAALEARVDDRNRSITELRQELKREKNGRESLQQKVMALLSDPHKLGTPLFAAIRDDSSFRDQNLAAIDHYGFPFPVTVVAGTGKQAYVIQGGPGGQYKASDVDLYAKINDQAICLSPSPAAWLCPAEIPDGYTLENPHRFDLFKQKGAI